MQNKKNEKLIKMIITVVVIILLVWLVVINPLLNFKSMENEVLDASKRYFEINTNMLPTGNKIRKISLQTLYDKDYIKEDLRAPYTNKYCDAENSWVRVTKDGNDYKYSVYLECGMFKSKTDHKGPEIKLNGKDEVTIYQGETYKDAGIKSVTDDTDGKMKTSQVEVDTSKVDTSKVGTYEVTYTVSDSLENKTVKTRTVRVIQTLNNIVKKNTDKTKVYKGQHDDNYVMLDGIMFKIVGINSDNTVKLVSSEALASVDYAGIDSWLNDYFYEKLSDSAKEYIVKSKWCNEKVTVPSKYTTCDGYSKKKYVGLLSIADYNNSVDDNGVSNLNNATAVWTANAKSTKKAWVNSYFDITNGGTQEDIEFNNEEIFNVKPAVNIIEDATVSSGDGTTSNPYILKKNKQSTKKGDKISSVVTGSYISYSGYTWRVIGKEDDETTKVVMIEPLSGTEGTYYTEYDSSINYYNPNTKTNLAYKIVNDVSSYVKSSYFDKKNTEILQYKNKVKYGSSSATKKYNVKFTAVSLYDLYSANSKTSNSTWYQEISKENEYVYVNSATTGVYKEQFNTETQYSVRLTGYLNKNVVIKGGSGTSTEPYTLTK